MHPPQPSGATRNYPILVAGGSADRRQYLTGCLRVLSPVPVVEATTGRATLHLARAFSPVLIIAEYMMPGLRSPVLCRALRADPRTRDTPVLLTGHGAPPDPPVGDGYLGQPFNAMHLQAEVERLLGRALAPHPPPP